MDTKRCRACGELKPLCDFHRHGQNKGLRPRCKLCRSAEYRSLDHRAYNKDYYAKNRAQRLAAHREYRLTNAVSIAAQQKKWREQNRDGLRSKVLLRNYGISLSQWEEMFAAQGKACLICRSLDPGSKRGWHTDHGITVRGILCHHCNTGLGSFNHDIGRLKAAIRYLAK